MEKTWCSHGRLRLCRSFWLGVLIFTKEIEKLIPKNQIGLYRDDGLAAVTASWSQMDRIWKEVTKTFLDESLKIADNMKIKTTNFLDVNLNLETEEYKPFRKDNNKPNYINIRSCHPTCIKGIGHHLVFHLLQMSILQPTF